MAHAGISTTLVEKNRSPSPPSQLQVRTVGIGEYREVSECLAQAFAQDEVARYFFDTDDMEGYSEAYKWKLHSDILRYIVAAHCYNGIVTTVGENYGAVALWFVPPFPPLSLHTLSAHVATLTIAERNANADVMGD
jgi:hypothetical protein